MNFTWNLVLFRIYRTGISMIPSVSGLKLWITPTTMTSGKPRNPLRYLGNIKPAVLEVGGWFDAEDLFGTLNTYKTIEMENPENQNRLIMGPWSHHQWGHEAGGSPWQYFLGRQYHGLFQYPGTEIFQLLS